MPSLRRFRLASASALALVIGLGLAAPSAGAAASPLDPFDEVRERLFGGVSASSTAGGTGSTTGGAGSTGGGAAGSTAAGSRIGHVVDAIDDVHGFTLEDDDTVPARYLRTVDINRFGYHFGQRTAKFTIRTRDLRNVKGAETVLVVGVRTRSRGATDQFLVSTSGKHSTVETDTGWSRPCPGRSVTRDVARNTVTIRVPMSCLAGRNQPTSMQPAAAAVLFGDDFVAIDSTYFARRADVRR